MVGILTNKEPILGISMENFFKLLMKRHERDHGYVVKKQQGTPHHLLKSLQSLSTYNRMRIGGIYIEEK